MKYEQQTCAECEQKLMAVNGRVVQHFVRGTNIDCEGSLELSLEAEGLITGAPVQEKPASVPRAVQPETDTKVEPAPEEPKPQRELLPSFRRRPLEVEIELARQRLKYGQAAGGATGSLDLEKLLESGCPSLQEAILEYMDE